MTFFLNEAQVRQSWLSQWPAVWVPDFTALRSVSGIHAVFGDSSRP